MFFLEDDAICAIATPAGVGGIAVIRVSGLNALDMVAPLVRSKKKGLDLTKMLTHRLYFAEFVCEGEVLDEVMVSVFRAPNSYTGEDVVEISCHGSLYVQRRIMEVLIASGVRLAQGGEFSMRRFFHGKMDLSQVEAIMDVIGAENKASHQIAMRQLRGGFSSDIAILRQKLLNFASLIELELDFSEEDVEFADRAQLMILLGEIKETIVKLRSSFALGNVLKNGISVAIVGRPNVGKSTLLNALLNEEKAIVSEIPGTTRDVIEDVVNLDGVLFRFIDTAGLRETEDVIEKMGIERTKTRMEGAQVVLYMFDAGAQSVEEVVEEVEEMMGAWENEGVMEGKQLVLVGNKVDELSNLREEGVASVEGTLGGYRVVWVSAKEKRNLEGVEGALRAEVNLEGIEDRTIVINARHYEALSLGLADVERVEEGLRNEVPGDLVAIDIRVTLGHLGMITGEIVSDEVLENVFGRFCIGK